MGNVASLVTEGFSVAALVSRLAGYARLRTIIAFKFADAASVIASFHSGELAVANRTACFGGPVTSEPTAVGGSEIIWASEIVRDSVLVTTAFECSFTNPGIRESAT